MAERGWQPHEGREEGDGLEMQPPRGERIGRGKERKSGLMPEY